jgi:hypothetical protein
LLFYAESSLEILILAHLIPIKLLTDVYKDKIKLNKFFFGNASEKTRWRSQKTK